MGTGSQATTNRLSAALWHAGPPLVFVIKTARSRSTYAIWILNCRIVFACVGNAAEECFHFHPRFPSVFFPRLCLERCWLSVRACSLSATPCFHFHSSTRSHPQSSSAGRTEVRGGVCGLRAASVAGPGCKPANVRLPGRFFYLEAPGC